MVVRGVRSSWLSTLRNSSLARFAAAASSAARTSCARRRWSVSCSAAIAAPVAAKMTSAIRSPGSETAKEPTGGSQK